MQASMDMIVEGAVVAAVARDDEHRFSKRVVPQIELVAARGVRGDAHFGETVQHRSRVAVDPTQPNLRQVHFIAAELLEQLAAYGLVPGSLGENVLTRGLDLLALPRGTLLSLGADAVVEITGLRNPCAQIEKFRSGLLAEVLEKTSDGRVIRKAGIMGIVRTGGLVPTGAPIRVTLPPPPHAALERV